jgi:(p)ppGpp synthase/HD superfamily hydrolase
MINYTERLDSALRISARAHEQQQHHRKGTDIPYIMHPFATMLIASNATSDEDVLIACLLHDVLEDVDSHIYSQQQMQTDFGDAVLAIVKDVTKDSSAKDWHERSKKYLKHLQAGASDKAVIVSAADKIHNLISVNIDYETHGDELWDRFKTKNSQDQLWWYVSILDVITKRHAPQELVKSLTQQLNILKAKI